MEINKKAYSQLSSILNNLKESEYVKIPEKQIKFTKSNKTMAFLKFEDLYGETEIILFPNVYEKYSEKLFYDSPIIVHGFLKLHESELPKIICDQIELLSEKQ